MHKEKDYKISLNRIKSYCALQDRCQFDVLKKLTDWGLQKRTQENILKALIIDDFINEKRFAASFCRGKFKIKNWGKHKIITQLKSKNISAELINAGLKEIDENEYEKILEKLFYQKKETLNEKNKFKQNIQIAKFLIQRGFENNLVWTKIKELSNK